MDELIRLTARQAVAGLAKGEFTPLELIDAAERRVAAVDGDINALVTRCFDRARAQARHLPSLPSQDEERGQLHGLPIAIKDLTDVAGVRCTLGIDAVRRSGAGPLRHSG